MPTLCERIARVADLSAELDAASGFEDVMRLAGQVFDLYESDRQFLSGVPMPGHGLEPLVILNTWRGAKSTACMPEPDDVVILKAQGWHSPFILRERYFGVSGLARHAALEETGRRLLIIPITMVLKYQGLAVMTFRPDPALAGGLAEDSMKPCERGQLGLFLNLVFRRLSDLGILDRRREGELTAREREVLVFTAFGETASVTAHRLGISERTIVAHRQSAMHKLGACNTSEAVVKALLYGEIGPGAGFGFYKMAEEILVAGNYDYRETFA